MKNLKGQVNQVFVFLLSIIIILFVGFLVTKFVFTFGDDAKNLAENQFFKNIEQDYESIYKSYGSEKVITYKVSSKIELVCFVEKNDCIDSLTKLNEISPNAKQELNISVNSGDNLVLFDKTGIIRNERIKDFKIESGGGCFCKKPNNGRFEVIWENKRNEVYLYE